MPDASLIITCQIAAKERIHSSSLFCAVLCCAVLCFRQLCDDYRRTRAMEGSRVVIWPTESERWRTIFRSISFLIGSRRETVSVLILVQRCTGGFLLLPIRRMDSWEAQGPKKASKQGEWNWESRTYRIFQEHGALCESKWQSRNAIYYYSVAKRLPRELISNGGVDNW